MWCLVSLFGFLKILGTPLCFLIYSFIRVSRQFFIEINRVYVDKFVVIFKLIIDHCRNISRLISFIENGHRLRAIHHVAKSALHIFNLLVEQSPTHQVLFTNGFSTEFPGTFINNRLKEIGIILFNLRRTGTKSSFAYLLQSLTGRDLCYRAYFIRTYQCITSLGKHQQHIGITHHNPIDTGRDT